MSAAVAAVELEQVGAIAIRVGVVLGLITLVLGLLQRVLAEDSNEEGIRVCACFLGTAPSAVVATKTL